MIRFGRFDGEPEILRLSSVLRRAREQGLHEAAAEVERVAAEFPSALTTGGSRTRSWVMLESRSLVCPWCSDPPVLEAWKAEGKRAWDE